MFIIGELASTFLPVCWRTSFIFCFIVESSSSCGTITSLDVGHCSFNGEAISFDWNVLHSYLLTSWKPVFMGWSGKLMHRWQIFRLWSLIVVKFELVLLTIFFKGQRYIATFCCPYDSFVRLQHTPFSRNIGSVVVLMGIWRW